MKIAAVVPAYNEAHRISNVLNALLAVPEIYEVIAVNDGSQDRTAAVIRQFEEVRLIDLEDNCGKGGAMMAGACATEADALVFFDADLIGLTSDHVRRLILPIATGRAGMSLGIFRGGRLLTDWSQKLVSSVSGQRAIYRDIFLSIPNLVKTRYGVETAINRYVHHMQLKVEYVPLIGVTHPMKEEKLGLMRGVASRSRMYYEILKIMMEPIDISAANRPPYSKPINDYYKNGNSHHHRPMKAFARAIATQWDRLGKRRDDD
ncbi:MAG: glycosyltransferase family 2 protein [Armatimonadetes bacterium]|nr:glycosyltransferase family 2 protein [Armatimonadota bacterium]